MRMTTIAVLTLLAALLARPIPALAGDGDSADEPPAAQQAEQSAEAAPAAMAAAQEFKVPPGFRQKTRGKHTVYCRKEKPIGTRFDTETCYDEQGLRDYVRAQQEDQAMMDKTRRICAGQGAVCGGS